MNFRCDLINFRVLSLFESGILPQTIPECPKFLSKHQKEHLEKLLFYLIFRCTPKKKEETADSIGLGHFTCIN